MNAIVSVIGQNRVGIIAAISSKLASLGIDILDVSQTILNGNFTMIMVVDISGSSAPFSALRDELDALGKQMQLSVKSQRQEIFEAMYTV